jgi:catechol 2,3-dioxygenase-like lactoylglutathione lyase family enzyme
VIGPVHHVAIATRDPQRLATFYEGLGLARVKEHKEDDGRVRSVWLDLGGAALLMLERADAPAPEATDFAQKTPGFHLLALSIAAANRSRVLQLLHERGVRVEQQTAFTVYLRDPDGNRIGLSHYPEPA